MENEDETCIVLIDGSLNCQQNKNRLELDCASRLVLQLLLNLFPDTEWRLMSRLYHMVYVSIGFDQDRGSTVMSRA